MTDPIRILVVDDHLVVREGLRMILETEPGYETVGEAADGVAALEEVARLRPQVMLMDLRMPRLGGLATLARMAREAPEVAVVVLTTFNEDDLMTRALRAGARGYLLKDCSRQQLVDAVRAAARGEALLAPEMLQRLLAASAKVDRPNPTKTNLSERELEVLNAVARGLRSKEIADRLGISERTGKAHLAGIFK